MKIFRSHTYGCHIPMDMVFPGRLYQYLLICIKAVRNEWHVMVLLSVSFWHLNPCFDVLYLQFKWQHIFKIIVMKQVMNFTQLWYLFRWSIYSLVTAGSLRSEIVQVDDGHWLVTSVCLILIEQCIVVQCTWLWHQIIMSRQ